MKNKEWIFPVFDKDIYHIKVVFYSEKDITKARKSFDSYVQSLVNAKIESILVDGIK